LNGTDTNQTVVITTTGGACPSGCTSTGIPNSIRYLDQNHPSIAWHRGDSLVSLDGGWASTWADLSGNGFTLTASIGGSGTLPITLTSLNGATVPTFLATKQQYATATTDILDGGTFAHLCGTGSPVAIASIICPTLTSAQQGFATVMTGAASPGINVTSTATAAGGGSDYFTAATTGANGSIVSGSCYRVGYAANSTSTYEITGSTVVTGTAGIPTAVVQYVLGAGGTAINGSTFYGTGILAETLTTCGAVTQAELQRQLNVMQTTWTGATVVN
jgi:hypothetical protein